jgi:hypothetical protein
MSTIRTTHLINKAASELTALCGGDLPHDLFIGAEFIADADNACCRCLELHAEQRRQSPSSTES